MWAAKDKLAAAQADFASLITPAPTGLSDREQALGQDQSLQAISNEFVHLHTCLRAWQEATVRYLSMAKTATKRAGERAARLRAEADRLEGKNLTPLEQRVADCKD